MIEQVTIQNYKCLRDVTLTLSPFTVLIGPNDSGKSSVLDALATVGRPSSSMSEGSVSRASLVWRAESDRTMTWKLAGHFGAREWTYELALPVLGNPTQERWSVEGSPVLEFSRSGYRLAFGTTWLRDASGYASDVNSAHLYALPALATEAGRALLRSFTAPRKFRFDPAALRRPSEPTLSVEMAPDGANLAAVLDAIISGPDRDAIVALERDLQRAVPTLRGVALRTVKIDNDRLGKALEFTLAGGSSRVTIPAAQASEGALLLTAFLALAHGDTPDVLLIEEPENGLHPSRLGMVIDLLRKISTGEVGNRPRQVIVTTHSPLLLNYARADEVRVVRRDLETGTTVRPMSEVPELSKLLEEFGIGELWYTLGEEGLFAKAQP